MRKLDLSTRRVQLILNKCKGVRRKKACKKLELINYLQKKREGWKSTLKKSHMKET